MSAPWYDVDELMSAISDMRGQNLGVQSIRDQSLQKLHKRAIFRAPYSDTERFPLNKIYICEAVGNWGKTLQQLRAALMFKDERNVGNARGDPNNGAGTNVKPAANGGGSPPEQQQNDAFNAAINATTTIMDEIVKFQDLLDQFSFETRYTNKWYPLAANNIDFAAEPLPPTAMFGQPGSSNSN